MSSYPANLIEALRAEPGLKLSERATQNPDWWPKDAPQDKKTAQKRMEEIAQPLSDLQERLFAASVQGQEAPSVLLIVQGMDTSGKGGIVRHVLGMLDPQGVEHHAFKAPTAEESAHDFLWRITKHLPGRGKVGVFDRSHYEDVLIARVKELASPEVLDSRYTKIVDFEKQLVEQNIHPIRVMLHISRDEQYEAARRTPGPSRQALEVLARGYRRPTAVGGLPAGVREMHANRTDNKDRTVACGSSRPEMAGTPVRC